MLNFEINKAQSERNELAQRMGNLTSKYDSYVEEMGKERQVV